MKKKGKKGKERSNKWTGPTHQAAHVPLPLLSWLLPSLSRSQISRSRSSAVAALSLSRSPLCFARPSPDARCSASLAPLRMRCSASLRPSASPPSLLSVQLYSRRRLLPDRAGDGRIEKASNRIDEKTVESSGPASKSRGEGGIEGAQHAHKARRRRLTPEASLERPDA
jgi:hypothetical protein